MGTSLPVVPRKGTTQSGIWIIVKLEILRNVGFKWGTVCTPVELMLFYWRFLGTDCPYVKRKIHVSL